MEDVPVWTLTQIQAEQYAQKKWGKNIVIGDDGGISWQKKDIDKNLDR